MANLEFTDSDIRWHDGELGYLICLLAQHGDDNVGRDPKTVATYLRVQARWRVP